MSIECIWGVWVWVLCPFLCVYLWDEGVNIRLRAWGWERMLVYMCACSSSSMCQVGPQTPPHSSSQSTPTPPTCPAGGGCRRCVGGFSRGLHCGCRRSHLRAILCPFLGGGRGCPCGGSPGGSMPWGAPGCLGPGSFSCLAGWGCCSPHTLLNIYMEEHKRAHTHRCTLKHSHWCKNRCSQTHIVLICCCFKTYFVILIMCAAQ